MRENLCVSNRNYGELCTNTYMKAIEIWRIMHENLYESNRNYGELCTNTDMKAIEIMANYARKPI